MSDLQQLKHQKTQLEKDIESLQEMYNQEVDEQKEFEWQASIDAKKIELDHMNQRIYKTQSEIQSRFLNNMFRKRSIDAKESSVYNDAKKDAESIAFAIIAIPTEEIASYFSTPKLIITPDIINSGKVHPRKFIHRWYIEVDGDKNIIPLSPGIQIPQRQCKSTRKYIDVQFKLDRVLMNPNFQNACRNYYKQYGIEIKISKDTNYHKRKRLWICLRVTKGTIYFPSHQN